jgi:hypothetical protein
MAKERVGQPSFPPPPPQSYENFIAETLQLTGLILMNGLRTLHEAENESNVQL